MSTHRRTFLQATSAAVGAAALAAPAIQGQNANERINIGLIGTGGRCRRLMQSLARIPNVRMAAICDIYDRHLNLARKLAHPNAFATQNYQQILQRKDIDAVLIGTPDHWHAPMTIAACAAGKDVYVEKPLTHDLSEGPRVIQAQNRHNRIVQVGTQQRSMPHIIRARELVQKGRLGTLYKVHMQWNRNVDRVRRKVENINPRQVDWNAFLGNARKQPFNAYRFRNWRWFWDFGNGILGDLMVHWVDVAHWILNLDHPQKAVTIGMQTISRGIWETPDTIQTLMEYPNNIQMHFEGTFVNANRRAMIEIMGSDGTLYIDRGRFEIRPERGRGKPVEMVLGKGDRGLDFYTNPDGELLHLTHWIDCIRNRRRPNTPAEAGVHAASAAHLGNIALRRNRVAQWAKNNS